MADGRARYWVRFVPGLAGVMLNTLLVVLVVVVICAVAIRLIR